MCGRFLSGADELTWQEYRELLGLPITASPPGEGDRSPTQPVSAVRVVPGGGDREVVELRWGLLPPWAKTRKDARKLFNVRSETAPSKFRAAFRKARCVIPARGFYEWKAPPRGGKKKIQYVISDAARPLMSFAGLWSRWEDDEGVVETCSILTTEANAQIRPVHHRMPVILDVEGADRWLDDGARQEDLVRLLASRDIETLRVEPLSESVAVQRQGSLF